MGSLRKSGVFTTVRCSGLELINGDGSTPAPNSVLATRDDGVVQPTRNITVQTVNAQEVDINGGALTYSNSTGLLFNGQQVMKDYTFLPSNIRYFVLYSQSASDLSDAVIEWPDSLWTDVAGPISPAEWACSIVGIDYNYTGVPISSPSPQYVATCYPGGEKWYLRRKMPSGNSALMGFHIMAVRRTVCDDRRFALQRPIALSVDPSGNGILVRWGDIRAIYPNIKYVQISITARTATTIDVPVGELRYFIGNLLPTYPYTVTTRYKDIGGNLGPFTITNINTRSAMPPAVVVSAVTSRSFTLQWYNPPTNATALRIQKVPGGTIDVDPTLGEYSFHDLSANTAYTLTSQYAFTSGASDSVLTQITTESLPALSNLILGDATATTFSVRWNLPVSVPSWISKIRLRWGDTGEVLLNPTETQTAITGLLQGTSYPVSVAFFDGYQSGPVLSGTQATSVVPAASFGVNPAAPPMRIDVSWGTPPTFVTDVYVYWRNWHPTAQNQWMKSPNRIGETSYSIINVNPQIVYEIYVQFESNGAKGPYTTQTAVAPAIPTPTLSFSNGTRSSVDISWTAAPAGYNIVNARFICTIQVPGGATIVNDVISATQTSYSLSNLLSGTPYTISLAWIVGANTGNAGTITYRTSDIPRPLFGFTSKTTEGSLVLSTDRSLEFPYRAGFVVTQTSPWRGFTINRVVFPETIQSYIVYGMVACYVYSDSTLTNLLASCPQQRVLTDTNQSIYRTITLAMSSPVTLQAGNYILVVVEPHQNQQIWDGYTDISIKFSSFNAADGLTPVIGGNAQQYLPNYAPVPDYESLYVWENGKGILCNFGLTPTITVQALTPFAFSVVWGALPADVETIRVYTKKSTETAYTMTPLTTGGPQVFLADPSGAYTIYATYYAQGVEGPSDSVTTVTLPAMPAPVFNAMLASSSPTSLKDIITVSWNAAPYTQITGAKVYYTDTTTNVVSTKTVTPAGTGTTLTDVVWGTSYSVRVVWLAGTTESGSETPVTVQMPPKTFGFNSDGNIGGVQNISQFSNYPYRAAFTVPSTSSWIGYKFNVIQFNASVAAFPPFAGAGKLKCTVYSDASFGTILASSNIVSVNAQTSGPNTVAQSPTLTMDNLVTLGANQYIVFSSERYPADSQETTLELDFVNPYASPPSPTKLTPLRGDLTGDGTTFTTTDQYGQPLGNFRCNFVWVS